MSNLSTALKTALAFQSRPRRASSWSGQYRRSTSRSSSSACCQASLSRYTGTSAKIEHCKSLWTRSWTCPSSGCRRNVREEADRERAHSPVSRRNCPGDHGGADRGRPRSRASGRTRVSMDRQATRVRVGTVGAHLPNKSLMSQCWSKAWKLCLLYHSSLGNRWQAPQKDLGSVFDSHVRLFFWKSEESQDRVCEQTLDAHDREKEQGSRTQHVFIAQNGVRVPWGRTRSGGMLCFCLVSVRVELFFSIFQSLRHCGWQCCD